MRLMLKLGAGILARFVGMFTEHFAQWLFGQISEGEDEIGESFSDLCRFFKWFMRTLAAQLGGRSRRRFDEYGDEYEPGFYGGR